MKLSSYIDYTNLKPDAKSEDIEKLCVEANKSEYFSVCINPAYISLVKSKLDESVKITTVIGFPLGSTLSEVKAFETKKAIELGVDEVDMVMNISALKNKDYEYVESDIKQVRNECKDKTLKVIIETCLLSDEEIVKACEIAKSAGADFVKTSTGFSTGGATESAVALMRKTVGSEMGVKASGGIKTKEDAERMIAAGASRIGTSSNLV